MANIKIVLGKRLESIHRNVKVTLPDGKVGTIGVDFKYRTRREFAQFVDSMVKEAAEQAKADAEAIEAKVGEAATFSTYDLADATVRSNARYLSEAIVGWDLGTELTEDSLVQLCDELPGVAQSLMDAYRAALTEGRAGN